MCSSFFTNFPENCVNRYAQNKLQLQMFSELPWISLLIKWKNKSILIMH